MKIVHITTTHARNEVRIFLKECLSLLSAGYKVNLIVADGLGNSCTNGVYIHDVGLYRGRFIRFFIIPFVMFLKARDIKADLYHFHEPELLLIALLLKITGGKLVYDSHEDVPRAIMGRQWIPLIFRNIMSRLFEKFENFIVSHIDAVVGATPHITKRFKIINKNSININNYPLMKEILNKNCFLYNNVSICYQGAISRQRGIFEILESLKYTNINLSLAGPIDAEIELELKSKKEWERVEYYGLISRGEVIDIMQRSSLGLVIFHPEGNHVNAQPNKMFEYMSAGLPVIASNFPLWREIIEGNHCGICVDPFNPRKIAEAVDYIITHPDEARQMGKNGRRIVINKYNWDCEEKKLYDLYRYLLQD